MTTLLPRSSVTLKLSKQAMKFSAGHFTIFGPGQRERLHGHDYRVSTTLRVRVGENGLCFDYGLMKQQLMALCDELDEYVLLPGESPLLRIEREGSQLHAVFGDERIPFLAADVLVLPVANITLEELARWFLGRMLETCRNFAEWGVDSFEISVEAGPGQSASMTWPETG